MHIDITLVVQMIAFMALVWLVNKILWKPLNAILSTRQEKIADGLAAAERGKRQLELASRQSTEILGEAKRKAADFIVEAQNRAIQIIEEAKGAATIEHDRLLTEAKLEIEQEVLRAREVMRNQIVDFVVSGAEKILQREINEQSNTDLVAALIDGM